MKRTFALPTHVIPVAVSMAADSLKSTASERFQDVMAQAETCCEQARLAARARRFRAASGLFSTAAALYKRATLLEGVSYQSVEARLSQIEDEMAAYSELARSISRPLASHARPSAAPGIAPGAVSERRSTEVVSGETELCS